jgi:hypothetical protein
LLVRTDRTKHLSLTISNLPVGTVPIGTVREICFYFHVELDLTVIENWFYVFLTVFSLTVRKIHISSSEWIGGLPFKEPSVVHK